MTLARTAPRRTVFAWDEALDMLGRAGECAEALGRDDEVVRIDERRGEAAHAQGDQIAAAEHYERALAAREGRAARSPDAGAARRGRRGASVGTRPGRPSAAGCAAQEPRLIVAGGMDRTLELVQVCRAHGVLACYLFGSRADDGKAVLEGTPTGGGGSDLDVGVLFERTELPAARSLATLQIALEDLFAPLHVDLVPLDRVDPLFQFGAVSGHRVAALDPGRVDRIELRIMRSAAELLPVQRELDRDLFGTSNR